MPHEAATKTPHARTVTRQGALTISRPAFVSFILGAATVAGFAPLYLYPLPVVTLSMLAWLQIGARTPKGAAALGWWFGLGFFLTGVSWVYVSLHTFGAMPAPVAAFFTLVFCAYLALFPAFTSWLVAVLRAPLWIKLAVVFPSAWTLTEWVRGWLFTGFPWLAMGYSQVPDSALAGYAPVLGVYGLSFLSVLSAGLAVVAIRKWRVRGGNGRSSQKRAAAGVILAFCALWLSGVALKQVSWTTPAGEPLDVALLQGNIPQEIKWTPEGLRTTLERYRDLAVASRAKLTVFPETALPLFLRDVPPDYLASLAAHARARGADVLIGVPELLPNGDYYNSVISLGASRSQVYRKSHLVPFGEFIPLRPVLGAIVNILAIPLQDFSRGPQRAEPLMVAGQKIAVNVCYEDAFGEEIIRPLPEATLLVNVSNVAWFGRSIAPRQHLQISQARALETGRYMLRSTNTGMTAVVDNAGRIVAVAPQFTTATVQATVRGYSGSTPYVRWGNGAILALCSIVLAASILYALRAESKSAA